MLKPVQMQIVTANADFMIPKTNASFYAAHAMVMGHVKKNAMKTLTHARIVGNKEY